MLCTSVMIKARNLSTMDLIRLAASRQSTFPKGEGFGEGGRLVDDIALKGEVAREAGRRERGTE